MKATIDVPPIKLNPGMGQRKPSSDREVILFDIPEPGNNDVLSGRGVTTNKHAGNVNFRSLVALNKELYVTSTKKQKMAISRSIVEAVRSMEPAGRFLDKSAETGLWSDIGDRKAIEKTSQALRDGAATLRKQLSEDLGDPDFLSAVFENDSGATSSTVRSDGSASSCSSAEAKVPSKSRPMKAKMAKKGHRRAKSVPANTLEEDTKKAASATKNRSSSAEKSRHARSSSLDHTAIAAAAAAVSPPKRTSRSASTGAAKRPPQTKSRHYDSYPLEDEGSMLGDMSASGPWGMGHSRNSSASSGTLPPFFPMSPMGGRGPPAAHHAPQHIFSCFQEANKSGRPPMSPMHRSWSPRDFQHSPFNWRQSIGGTTCYSEGDVVDVHNMDRSLDRTFDTTFSVDEEMHLETMLAPRSEDPANSAAPEADTVGSGEAHEKLSLSSNHSLVPSSTVKDAMADDSDMDLNFSPTLACDFGDGKGNALDDVVMRDIDPAEDDGMSPLPFFNEADTTLLDNLPDLLQMPIAPCGPYDNKFSST